MRYGTMYYWRVCAINNADTSGWSATWQFHTVDWVVLDSPSNNSTGLAVSSRTLYWNNSRGSSSYIVQVDTTTNFNSELLRNLSISSSTTNTDTYKSTSITNMLYGTTYYWRVCAANAVDTSGWSSVWRFTTAYQLTTAPTLVSPANGSNEIQPSGVDLVWNPLDNVTGYRYQVWNHRQHNCQLLSKLRHNLLLARSGLQCKRKFGLVSGVEFRDTSV